MHWRITFAISDDNLLAGAKDRSPSAGFKLAADRLFYDAIEQEKRGFETETQLVVYKRMPTFFKRMDAEAAFVTEIEQWHDGKTFQEFYGTGKHGRNAYGKCVSSKARAFKHQQDEADKQDAKKLPYKIDDDRHQSLAGAENRLNQSSMVTSAKSRNSPASRKRP